MRFLRFLLVLLTVSCGSDADAPAPGESPGTNTNLTEQAPPSHPDDPLAASLSAQDPEVIRIVEAARDKVRASEEDPIAWRELGLSFEANHLPLLAVPAYERSTRLAPAEAKGWYRLALTQEAAGRYDEALASFRTALELEKRFPPLHWHLGLLLLERGELDEARTAFRRAVRLHPGDPGGWTGLARVHLQLDKPALAIDNLNQVLTLLPDDPYGRSLLATALRQAGRFDEWRGAPPQTGAQPNWPDPLSLELARFRANTAISRQDRAVRAASSEGPEAAIPTLEKLVRKSPEDVSLLSKLGLSLAGAGRLKESAEVLGRALALEPDNRTVLVDLAVVLSRSGDPQAAAELLERATALHPTFARAHEVLSDVRETTGDLAGAIASLAEALRHDQRRPEPFVRMGFLRLKNDEPKEAERHFALALDLAPSDARALIGSALALLESGAREEARARIHLVPQEARRGKLWERVPTDLSN